MKSISLKVFMGLLVILVIAGGSYLQINFNKDWREQYAYAKGVNAMNLCVPVPIKHSAAL